MKLLVFTDTHSSKTAEKKIIEKVKKYKPDLLLCCGDFSIFMHAAEEFLRKINSLKIKTFLIHGNHEDGKDIEELCKRHNHIEFFHNKIIKHDNVLFMGYGGGGFSLHDHDFKVVAKEFEKTIKKCKDCKKIILLHQPPHKSGIDLIYGENAGNKTTKKFIEKHKIHLVFAGHLHENSGMEYKIKSTKYINPGPLGKIIDI